MEFSFLFYNQRLMEKFLFNSALRKPDQQISFGSYPQDS